MFFIGLLVVWTFSTIINYHMLNRAAASRGVGLNKYRKFENLLFGIAFGPIMTVWGLLFADLFLNIIYFISKMLIMSDGFLEKTGSQAAALELVESSLGCGPRRFKPAKSKEEEKFIWSVRDETIEIHKWIEGIDYSRLTKDEIEHVIALFEDCLDRRKDGIIRFPRQKKILELAVSELEEIIAQLREYL